MENKQEICNLLAVTLQATDNASDILSIVYHKELETVVVTFLSGGKCVVNVAVDSGTAMIRDIIANLGC